MAKARSVEAKLSRLRALREQTPAAKHVAELRQALKDKSNLVVADAAEIAGERLLAELSTDLVAAFDRFLEDPAETDKQCRAKVAILETLNKLEYDRPDIYLTAIQHVQMEPRWGGSDDTAPPLRAAAAFGLVRINHPDALNLLADLLADPEKAARSGAAQALAGSGHRAALPLLRFKVRIGDEDPAVIGDCLTGLMTAAPDEALPFVKGFLEAPAEPVQEAAALALAEARTPAALDALIAFWPKVSRNTLLEEVLLLAIATTRLPAALEFLIEIVRSNEKSAVLAAISALAIHRHNPAVEERIAKIVKHKKDAAVKERFMRKFATKAQ